VENNLMINLISGDCLKVMECIPDASVDLIIADLPYGTTNCKWDTTLDLQVLWGQYKRVSKKNAAIILFAQTPFDKVLGCSNLPWLRYELVWEKTHPTGHLNSKRMPMKAHENILVFYAGLPTYNPQKTSGHVRKTAIKRQDNTEIYGEQMFSELSYDSTQRYPRSVLKFSSDNQRIALHPTQKPLALIEWLISTYSNIGDNVMDNCMGSGTTGVAAKNLGRKFIGIELDDGYFNIAKSRIEQIPHRLEK
jgi:DNA modification methylase